MIQEELRDELARLRARAYGVGADIADDPIALARLRELELLERRPWSSTSVNGHPPAAPDDDEAHAITTLAAADRAGSPADRSAPPGNGTIAPDDTTMDAGADAPAEAEAQASPSSLGSRRRGRVVALLRKPWVWAASLAVTAIASAAMTASFLSYDPTVVATLHPVETGSWPTDLWGGVEPEDSVQYEDYLGMTVLSGTLAGGERLLCLAVTVAPDSPDQNYIGTGNCAHPAFGVSADLLVGVSSSMESREEFPLGTALRFTVQDGVVIVRSVPPVDDGSS